MHGDGGKPPAYPAIVTTDGLSGRRSNGKLEKKTQDPALLAQGLPRERSRVEDISGRLRQAISGGKDAKKTLVHLGWISIVWLLIVVFTWHRGCGLREHAIKLH